MCPLDPSYKLVRLWLIYNPMNYSDIAYNTPLTNLQVNSTTQGASPRMYSQRGCQIINGLW